MNTKPRFSFLFLLAGILCLVLGGLSAFILKPDSSSDTQTIERVVAASAGQENSQNVNNAEAASSSDKSAANTEASSSSSADSAANSTAVSTAATADAASNAATVAFDHRYENSKEYAVINGLSSNSEVLWSRTTEQYDATQLDRVCDIGIWNNIYCYAEDRSVVALNLSDGSEVWRNTDFGGASVRSCTTSDMLIVCGYFGPDVMVLDQNGNTIKRIDSVNSDYYWPYELSFADGKIAITYEGTPSGSSETLYVDLNDTDSNGTNADNGQNGGNASSDDPNAAITGITASSYLVEPTYNLSHVPENTIDGNISTGWVENGSGNGEGESITITFNSAQNLSGFSIYNGYQQSQDLYYKNARASALQVRFSNGNTVEYELEDTMGEQSFFFNSPSPTDSITFTIVSTYSGNRYTDTVISEISFF